MNAQSLLLPAHTEPVGDRRRRKLDKATRLLIPDRDNPAIAYETVGGFFRIYASHTECWCEGQADPTIPTVIAQIEVPVYTPQKRMMHVYREINHAPPFATREQMAAERVDAFNAGVRINRESRKMDEKVYG